jgi:hypothetical protein
VRAVLRRLDPWAALLLGVLVTLGVIILLATPGPWHKVVPAVATHPPLAPPPPPRDIAVFVNGPRLEGCAGVVWLHIDYAQARFTAVVVTPSLTCLLPGAGFQPLSEIVDQAGPRLGAHALGARLGVKLDSWITVDPLALRAAIPGFVDAATKVVHPRPVPLVGVWSLRQPPNKALQRQVRYLRLWLRDGSAGELNLIGFVNYVIGSNDVDTALKLQAVSAIGAALNVADAGDFVATSLPVVVEHRGRYARWLPAPGALLALRQSFAFDAASPAYPATVDERPAGRTVLALTSPLGSWTKRYRTAFEAELRRYGVRGVRVEMRACAWPAAVSRALDRERARPPLGVVVAVGRSAVGTISAARAKAVLGAALAGVRDAALPTVVSEVPGATAMDDTIAAQATAAGLPLSPVAAALAVPVASGGPTLVASGSPTPGGTGGPTPGATGRSTSTASTSTASTSTASTSTASTSTASTSTASTSGGLTAALVAAWARLDAATFVRAVQPAFFAPRLAATRLGVSFYERTLTKVGVVDSDAAARASLMERLDVFGYQALRAPAGSLSAGVLPIVYYRAGDRRLALAVAGDLGLLTPQVLPTVGGAEGLTVVMSP